jgi:uncharacterized membrane protein YebE (DUF533 family)
MSVQSLLEQLLQSGMSKYREAKQSGDLDKYATGAVAGGTLAVLLGSRRGRSLGGTVLKVGTVAALGSLAWRAYNDWQAQQQGRRADAPAPAAGAAQGSTLPAPSFERLPAPQMEDHSRAMLKAMIAAAKADGHMDERERSVVDAELKRLAADPATRSWVEDELRRPVEPADVASASTSPQMAAEIYLASVLVVDDTTTMERAYLDELARQLKLAPALKAELEARAKSG